VAFECSRRRAHPVFGDITCRSVGEGAAYAQQYFGVVKVVCGQQLLAVIELANSDDALAVIKVCTVTVAGAVHPSAAV
jgi:hypothetical protein